MKSTSIIKTGLLFFTFFSLSNAMGQNCGGCTQTVSSSSTSNFTVNSGDVLCVTSTGSIDGNIIMNGGTVCNEGSISGNIIQNDGALYNYGIIDSLVNITHKKGILYNYGNFNIGFYLGSGEGLDFLNYGTINSQDFTLKQAIAGSACEGSNFGVIHANNVNIDSSSFYNYDTLKAAGNLNVRFSSYFLNDGPLHIVGNYNVLGNSHFHTNCLVLVDNIWNNSALTTGPTGSSCGGFIVGNLANNSGNLATDNSNVDVCVDNGSGSLNNTGTLGSQVTYCTCSNSCASGGSNGIANHNSKNDFELFPNPSSEYFIIQLQESTSSNYSIYDVYGKQIETGTILNNNLKRDVSGWPQGVYLIQVGSTVQKFIKN